MDDGGANVPTQVSLPDDSGVKAVVPPALISPTSQEQRPRRMYALSPSPVAGTGPQAVIRSAFPDFSKADSATAARTWSPAQCGAR